MAVKCKIFSVLLKEQIPQEQEITDFLKRKKILHVTQSSIEKDGKIIITVFYK